MVDDRPVVVSLGGTTRSGSSTERVVRYCAARLQQLGANAIALCADELALPLYGPDIADRDSRAERLVTALRRADGVVLVSPGYHGGISGMLKNAIDYVEDLADDRRPYFEGRVVGCVACASGWQAPSTTLVALRSIVHALRGWPTPLGVAVNSSLPLWNDAGDLTAGVSDQLEVMLNQVMWFAAAVRRTSAGDGQAGPEDHQ